mmetsp:Transcript_22230/g.66304  ORF Transcript_22230/g.66304 Transcript_22230/m.66304 type:complete len:181 (-) Transcript_22230:21-563(-)
MLSVAARMACTLVDMQAQLRGRAEHCGPEGARAGRQAGSSLGACAAFKAQLVPALGAHTPQGGCARRVGQERGGDSTAQAGGVYSYGWHMKSASEPAHQDSLVVETLRRTYVGILCCVQPGTVCRLGCVQHRSAHSGLCAFCAVCSLALCTAWDCAQPWTVRACSSTWSRGHTCCYWHHL